MKRIAVIGSGISGLAAAYYLSRRHEVSLFEKEPRVGGHTHTVKVESSAGPLAVDTGFIVHNDRTYPNLVRLLAELKIPTLTSDMSFSVSSRETGFEYSSRGFRGYFAQRTNLLRPGHFRLLAEIVRFNREAPGFLAQEREEDLTLGEFIERGGYSAEFTGKYLYPMASAVWSASIDSIRLFPALTLLRFFDNHGMLGLNTHPKWKVLRGGSGSYLEPITAPYRERIYAGVEIASVVRRESGVTLRFSDRPAADFDEVVFACHGDQVLPLLDAPTDSERDVLACFETSRNEVCLHTDDSLLPRRPRAQAAWNYNLGEGARAAATLTYNMNRLQSLRAEEIYCVTLNANGAVDPAKVLRRFVYFHPLYTWQAVKAQGRWAEISGKNHTHYCGAYWYYGFHEDGLNSARRVVASLGVDL